MTAEEKLRLVFCVKSGSNSKKKVKSWSRIDQNVEWVRLHVQLCNLGNSEMCNTEELKIWVMKHSKIKMLRLMLIILLSLSAEVYSAKRAISGRPDGKLSGAAEGKTASL